MTQGTDLDRAVSEALAEGLAIGRAEGHAEGRYETFNLLQPYLQHIGNCGAVGSDPENSRCLCGLRQVWLT